MFNNIDLNALANFVETLDCNSDYEDDQFAFTFDDARVYCERKKSHFRLEIGSTIFELPRC
ncbi:hypothetical protein E5554_15920 [Sphingobium sp. PAMC28499]|uniref:hypothetical protein n=1 Tax=Sphingobium sp. PAMC28499 TaxID=2565554 RepID=UPI00109D898A|nr:hypothetical protein [Sphingobium sp. PAMC28499]QCB39180.1 hypothetical protein E5554_15920 [Sphingobium sp. PAMC28499]